MMRILFIGAMILSGVFLLSELSVVGNRHTSLQIRSVYADSIGTSNNSTLVSATDTQSQHEIIGSQCDTKGPSWGDPPAGPSDGATCDTQGPSCGDPPAGPSDGATCDTQGPSCGDPPAEPPPAGPPPGPPDGTSCDQIPNPMCGLPPCDGSTK